MNAVTKTNDVIDMDQPQRHAAPAVATPAALVQMAVQNGASMEQIGQLMDLQERWEAREARKAFVAAKAAFKQEDILITKDKENKQYKSFYTTLGNMVNTVTPFLGKHGLSAEWDQKMGEDGRITVECKLSHAAGHSESTFLTVPPDTAGAKNPIQQIKSAITYAKAVTFESICGLASSDANLDDDGNYSGGVAAVTAVAGENIAAKILDSLLVDLAEAKDEAATKAIWSTGSKALSATGIRSAYHEFKECVFKHKALLAARAGGTRP